MNLAFICIRKLFWTKMSAKVLSKMLSKQHLVVTLVIKAMYAIVQKFWVGNNFYVFESFTGLHLFDQKTVKTVKL